MGKGGNVCNRENDNRISDLGITERIDDSVGKEYNANIKPIKYIRYIGYIGY